MDLGVGLETEDASAMIPFGDESAGVVAAMAPTPPPPMDDRDEDAVRLARSRAATARLRAKEARSIATQKTATARGTRTRSIARPPPIRQGARVYEPSPINESSYNLYEQSHKATKGRQRTKDK